MHNTKSLAKKAISVIVALGMVISVFACMSGLSVFAVDNTPAPQTTVAKAPVKAATTAAAPKFEGEHVHCQCGQVAANASPVNDHTAHNDATFKPIAVGTNGMVEGGMPTYGLNYLTDDLVVTKQTTLAYDNYICLNGHTITLKISRMFQIPATYKIDREKDQTPWKRLVFTDCVGGGKVLQNGTDGVYGDSGIIARACVSNTLDSLTGKPFEYRIYFFGGEFDLRGSKQYSGGIFTLQTNTTDETNTATYSPYTNACHKVIVYNGTFIGDNLMDGTTPSSRAANGGLFTVSQNCSMTIFDGNFTGGNVKQYGGCFRVTDEGTLTIHGGTFQGSRIGEGNGGGTVIYSESGTTVNIDGGTFTGGQLVYLDKKPNTGGIIRASGTVNISGDAVFNPCSTYIDSGGVISSFGTLNISGNVKIHGARAYQGGALYLGDKGTTVIDLGEEGVIDATNPNANGGANVCTNQGGAIFVTGTQNLEIKGGTITGSNNTRSGGTIATVAGTTLTVSGGTINGGELYYGEGGDPTSNTSGATILANGALNISGGTINAGSIVADASNSKNNTGMCIYKSGTEPFVMTGGTVNGSSQYVAWGNAIITYSPTTISGTAVIHGGRAYKGGAIYLAGNGNTHTIALDEGGLIDSGAIDEEYPSSYGNIFVAKTNILNVGGTGGKITGKAYQGGAIYTEADKYDPEHPENQKKAILNITGGVIADGVTTSSGGNIYACGDVTVSGGIIENGECKGLGGNVNTQASFTMTGGTIRNGKSTTGGGNLYSNGRPAEGNTASITGGTLEGGVGTSGGSIITNDHTELKIGGTAVIDGGTATTGGNIYISSSSTLTVEGGTIKNGKTTADETTFAPRGGNISVGKNCVLNMTGGLIEGGQAGAWNNPKEGGSKQGFGGGNVFLYDETVFNLSGGTIKDGVSRTRGGGNIGAMDPGVVVNVTGGLVTGGRSTTASTGNIFMWYRDAGNCLNISGGKIETGEATDGDGLFAGGVWANYSSEGESLYSKTISVTGDAVIDDKIGVDRGSFLEITEFTGTITTIGVASTCVISQAWDKDYIAAEQISGLVEGYTYRYADGVVTIISEISNAKADAVAALDVTGEIGLADKDAVLAYDNLSDSTKETLGYTFNHLEAMVAEAQDYATMTEVKVKTVLLEDGSVLYGVYSSLDLAGIDDYEKAQLVITINNKTVGEDADIIDVYKNVIYSGDTFMSAADFVSETNEQYNKSDYIFYKTIKLNAEHAQAEINVEIYARIFVKSADKWVEGTHLKTTLAELYPSQGEPEQQDG